MAKDFKASQVRTSQIIASGSTAGKPSLVILSASSSGAEDFSGGGFSAATSGVGKDVFVFISGSVNSRGTSDAGTVLVGGDLVVSGNFEVKGVITGNVLAITSTNLTISDQVIYLASGSKSSNTNGGIAIASGSSIANQSLVFGRVANDTWGVGRQDVISGTTTDLTSMIPVALRASKFEAGGASTYISSSNGSSLEIAASTQVLVLSGGSSASSNVRNFSDVNFFVSGSTDSKNTSIRGTSLFGGDVVISGTLHGGSPLKISGSLGLSGSLYLQTQDSAPSVGTNESVLYVLESGGTKKLYWKNSDGTQQQVGTGGSSVTVTGTFNDVSGKLSTTGTFAVAGNKGFNYFADNVGNDINFFVSGTRGSRGTSTRGTSLFGGDVVMSGTIYGSTNTKIGDGLQITGSLSIGGGTSIGDGSSHATNQSIAAGTYGNFANNQSIVVGSRNVAGLEGIGTSIAVGEQNTVKGRANGAIGYQNNVSTDAFTSLAIGDNLMVSGGQVVEPNTGYTWQTSQVAIGSYNTLGNNTSLFVVGNGYFDDIYSFDTIRKDIFSVDGDMVRIGSGTKAPTDTFLYVTGTKKSRGTAVRGTAVFGGDLYVSGVSYFEQGLSGSLTRLTDGTPYLLAGSNITLATGTNGAVTITATGGGGGTPGGTDTQVQFNDGGSTFGGDAGLTYTKGTDTLNVTNVAMTATADQTWNLVDNSGGALNISAGTGNNRWTFNTGDGQERLGFWDNVKAGFGDINDPDLTIYHDGTNSLIRNKTGKLILSGVNVGLEVTGTTKFAQGLSGSLTRLTDGTSYLVAGSGISITTGSNGAVTITNDGTVGDITAVTAGTGLSGGGTSGAVTLNINDAVVATVSGTTFTGVVKANAGLSGSLTKLTDGSSYLIAGSNVTITTGSNGAVTIASTGGGGGSGTGFNDGGNKLNTTSSVAFAGGLGSSYYADSLANNVQFFVSGSKTGFGVAGTKDAVFGGNAVVSGSLKVGTGLEVAEVASVVTYLDSKNFLNISANGGGVDINDNNLIRFLSTNGVRLGSTFFGVNVGNDTHTFISGAIGSKNTSTKGVTVIGGDAFVSGTLTSNVSGSLTKLADGTSYLIAGSNVTITTGSNGAVTIASTGGGGSGTGFNDGGNKLNTTSSVAFAGGLGSSYYSDSVGSDVFLFVSGTQFQKGTAGAKTSVFAGDVVVSGALYGGVSSFTGNTILNLNASNIVLYGGAVQQEATKSDISVFVSGAIGSKNGANKGTSVFGGDVVISGTLYNANGTAYSTGGGGGGDSAATYVVISATGSLANERVLTAGTGISINDAGAGGNVTLSINDAIVATVSGTNFTGAVGVGSLVGPGGIASTGSLVVRAGPNNDSFFGAGCQTIHLIGTASAGHGGSIIFGDYASTYGVGIIEDIDDAILIKSKNRAQVKSTTSTINLNAGTQVLINAESVSPSPTTFTDTNFFVSGTVGSKNSATLGTAVFGGDMMISGSTYVASGSAILPVVDRGSDLGSPSKRWGNVYTGDLHLRNDRGDWTIVEEEDYLCVVNNKTGKKFKMALIPLEE